MSGARPMWLSLLESSGGDLVAEPGWYSDPSGRHELRYFDGTNWTGHVRNRIREPQGAPVLDEPPPLGADGAAGSTSARSVRGWKARRLLELAGPGLLILGAMMPWVALERRLEGGVAQTINGFTAMRVPHSGTGAIVRHPIGGGWYGGHLLTLTAFVVTLLMIRGYGRKAKAIGFVLLALDALLLLSQWPAFQSLETNYYASDSVPVPRFGVLVSLVGVVAALVVLRGLPIRLSEGSLPASSVSRSVRRFTDSRRVQRVIAAVAALVVAFAAWAIANPLPDTSQQYADKTCGTEEAKSLDLADKATLALAVANQASKVTDRNVIPSNVYERCLDVLGVDISTGYLNAKREAASSSEQEAESSETTPTASLDELRILAIDGLDYWKFGSARGDVELYLQERFGGPAFEVEGGEDSCESGKQLAQGLYGDLVVNFVAANGTTEWRFASYESGVTEYADDGRIRYATKLADLQTTKGFLAGSRGSEVARLYGRDSRYRANHAESVEPRDVAGWVVSDARGTNQYVFFQRRLAEPADTVRSVFAGTPCLLAEAES